MKLTARVFSLCALLMVISVSSQAQTPAKTSEADGDSVLQVQDPNAVVVGVTEELMAAVARGKETLAENPEPYFAEVRTIMESAVDFEYIARNVMGAKHWTAANDEQKARFVEVFTQNLVETYAKGMANFADLEVSVQERDEALEAKQRKAEVVQKFKGPKGVNYVSYTMGLHKSGEWRLINVVLDGVNLGKTLRAQFNQSVADNNGDLDKTISGWTWKT